MDVSIIIPLFNESKSLKELDDWISLSFKYKDLDYEVVYIDDGSNDSSWDIIKSISQNNSNRK
jgi:glycosyltransferase involved in cell wall biosynthesis